VAAGALARAPGPVLHEYGPSLRLTLGGGPAGAPTAAPAREAPIDESGLSSNEQLGLAAFRLRESPEYRASKESRPYQAATWAEGPTPLHPAEQPIVGGGSDGEVGKGGESGGGGGAAGGPSAAPMARRLAGRVAVGVIVVSGPGGLAFSNAQRTKIAAEVQNGLSWLGAQSPAKDVTWVHDSHHVTVTVPPAAGTPGGNQ
jgi:hypothetical protein